MERGSIDRQRSRGGSEGVSGLRRNCSGGGNGRGGVPGQSGQRGVSCRVGSGHAKGRAASGVDLNWGRVCRWRALVADRSLCDPGGGAIKGDSPGGAVARAAKDCSFLYRSLRVLGGRLTIQGRSRQSGQSVGCIRSLVKAAEGGASTAGGAAAGVRGRRALLAGGAYASDGGQPGDVARGRGASWIWRRGTRGLVSKEWVEEGSGCTECGRDRAGLQLLARRAPILVLAAAGARLSATGQRVEPPLQGPTSGSRRRLGLSSRSE